MISTLITLTKLYLTLCLLCAPFVAWEFANAPIREDYD